MAEDTDSAVDSQAAGQRPPASPYFGSIQSIADLNGPEAVHAMTQMVARARAQLQATLDSLQDKPELAQELWTAFLTDLDAWNVLVFANLGVNIPPSYYDAMYRAFRAATYRAIEWQKKQEG